ncbi:MAG: 2-isopropylmalate synthase [Candidatus Nanohalarchaeota archaeon]|nr:MAG: 2-isopropylmalate synthase [Candidatus Nanohaloarchaeota archaeon]
MRRIEIFDTTLRDGEQSPGATLNIDEKLAIAHQLAKLKVDTIEAGFPIASEDDFSSVKLIAENVAGPYICGLCRAVDADIIRAWDAVKYSDKPRIHTFIATSDLHLKYKLKKSRSEVLSMAKKAVGLARSFSERVEFSCEDASRSDPKFLCKVIGAAIEEGACVVNIPDTVGYSEVDEFGKLISYIREHVENIDGAVISVHCHNDLGLAVANSLEAVRRGAGQVECTVNGIGERAGNAALEEVVMNLKTKGSYFGCDCSVDTKEIYNTSRMVSRYTGIDVQRNKAIVGKNAFAHEAGIHQHGMLANPLCYEIMSPASIGKKTELVIGKHSGRHAVVSALEEFGYSFDGDELDLIVAKIKALADKQKSVLSDDIVAIADDVLCRSSVGNRYVVLDEVKVTCGNKVGAYADVKVRIDGKMKSACADGVGPVDAATNAIKKILGPEIVLREYELKAITGGTDALADVALVVAGKDGKEYRARGLDEDIVMASVKAIVNGVNMVRRGKKN